LSSSAGSGGDSPTSIATSDVSATELTRRFMEKCIDLLSKKCDSAMEDLDKNWTYQIITLGLGLGLIYGLGSAISKKLLEEPGHVRVLYLLIPLANLYFFVKFGLTATHFSQMRHDFEKIMTNYCTLGKSEGINFQDMDNIVISTYKTNSTFEHYHIATVPFFINVYFLFAPAIIGGGQGISAYLLKIFAGGQLKYQVAFVATYATICLALYYAYYKGNKELYHSIGSTHRILLIPLAIAFGVVVYWLMVEIGPTQAAETSSLSAIGVS
jgi:hypothetical protein